MAPASDDQCAVCTELLLNYIARGNELTDLRKRMQNRAYLNKVEARTALDRAKAVKQKARERLVTHQRNCDCHSVCRI